MELNLETSSSSRSAIRALKPETKSVRRIIMNLFHFHFSTFFKESAKICLCLSKHRPSFCFACDVIDGGREKQNMQIWWTADQLFNSFATRFFISLTLPSLILLQSDSLSCAYVLLLTVEKRNTNKYKTNLTNAKPHVPHYYRVERKGIMLLCDQGFMVKPSSGSRANSYQHCLCFHP